MAKKKLSFKPHQKKKSKLHRKTGKPPGTVTYMGHREGVASKVTIVNYNETDYEVHNADSVEETINHQVSSLYQWIDVVGISDEEFIENLGRHYGLGALVLEDAVNTQQRPKIDEYDDYIFGVFKMLYINDNNEMVAEHVALALVQNAVLVFQELEDDVFNSVRERIKIKTGRIRTRSSDYLFFALLDAIVDNYFIVLEHLNSRIETLEDEVYLNPRQEVAQKIQKLKKDVLKVRRWVFPVKELLSRLIDTENELIRKDTRPFLRDALDHSIEINESLQIYREMSMSLMEMYMSNMSNKMNEVMKVLTIMASIFIPLTFIAGIYGMNFDNMPELHWEYGYFMVWGVMIFLFLLMLVYFKRKHWL